MCGNRVWTNPQRQCDLLVTLAGREKPENEIALARLKALEGDADAYGYATLYAQWGNTPKALEWLETALRLRDPQLVSLTTEPLLDPLRQEPRFKAIERELKFPP